MTALILLFLMTITHMVTAQKLQELTKKNPFTYNLDVKIIPSKKKHTDVTICCHGYGHNNEIADVIHSFGVTKDHLVSFNFPDYDITDETDHAKSAYGSINEILPLIYMLKRTVCDLSISRINLYGFSAGGGAIINALAILHTGRYQEELTRIDVTAQDAKKIIDAVACGLITLDCPLKSMQEIIDLRGATKNFDILAQQFNRNNMNPINAIADLEGLKLHVLVHFQNPDEIIGNRDDALFIERLKRANSGTTHVVIGKDGGHNSYHETLWKQYKKLKK